MGIRMALVPRLAICWVLLAASPPSAFAEHKEIEQTVTTAIADGDYLKAIANLERMRNSAAISKNDPFVIENLKKAWRGYFLVDKIIAEPSLQNPASARHCSKDH